MSALLQQLDLEPIKGKARLSGLVSVKNDILPPAHLAEEVALHEVRLLFRADSQKTGPIDFIFFRRFTDGRSPKVAAYVVDNSLETVSQREIAELHRKVWLNGSAPLLYVEWKTRVDILRCAAGPEFWNKSREECEYHAAGSIEMASDVSRELNKQKVGHYSAFRLANGTFWEDPGNANWANADKAAHKTLIQTAIDVDNDIRKNTEKELFPIMRQLLLLFVFSKYLEDRDVFPKGWFSEFSTGAESFKDVLASQSPVAVQRMLDDLREKFNGDVFNLPQIADKVSAKILGRFVDLLDTRTIKRQLYLWDQYSFLYIPVEVLSHLYQHFAQAGTGAIYTPPFVADLILDHAMPYEKITGKETVLDPTCGSGIFLVGAFRRLVHHWQSLNEWRRPGVPLLKKILKQGIHGVEDLPEAAGVASLNLALAMCDALQPNVIWNDLTFDKLIGRNLLIGDFFDNLEALRKDCPNGFTTIVGNPPFTSKLTDAAESSRREALCDIAIPDKQIAYRVTEKCLDLLSNDGALCLLQPSRILYNAKTSAFRSRLFETYALESVLDFTAIRNLFEAADTKALALFMRKPAPAERHVVQHLTFRKTKSVSDRIGFELDHYDFHQISQEQVITCPWIWKANLVGGGRLSYLTAKIMEWPTLKEFIEEQGWSHGEGFIVGENEKRMKPCPWLKDKPFLPISALGKYGIESEKISKVIVTRMVSPGVPERFKPPMFLIKENEVFESDIWLKSELTFGHSIMSINSPSHEVEQLKDFARIFSKGRSDLIKFSMLKSSRSLIGKSTSILKRDIEELPWPIDAKIKSLSWWEKRLLDDISEFYAPLIRVGQNASVYKHAVENKSFALYAKTFVRLLGSVYQNLQMGRCEVADGIAYQAFHFGEIKDVDWGENWTTHLKDILYKEENASFRTLRIVRYYEGNTLVIIKPDRLRNWIPSTAIRDADETLVDLQEQGF